MNNSNVTDFMSQTMDKVRQMVDVNTIIGTPITTADGTTIIPVTKVTIGVGSGGSDFKGKATPDLDKTSFGGGAAAGITMSPVAFLIISNGETKILHINGPANSTADRVVEMVPDVVSKITDMFDKKTKKDEPKEAENFEI